MRKAKNALMKPRIIKKRSGASKTMSIEVLPGQSVLEAIGAEGERRIHEILVRLFGAHSVFRNVYAQRPSGNLTEIDLLVVCPMGVLVVESKNYAGLVRGSGGAERWIHEKTSGNRREFYSPVAQNRGHIDALRAWCMTTLRAAPPMLSLLVFPDKCELRITDLPAGLRCCRLSQLTQVLTEVSDLVKPTIDRALAAQLAGMFYWSQRALLPKQVQQQHLRDVAHAKRWRNKEQ
ncbi:hypothetical protein FACS1894208_00520 [Clostridia bacterium]|nr:hypothetical protein FACS1894208_00520 [Clostridia bacterium]